MKTTLNSDFEQELLGKNSPLSKLRRILAHPVAHNALSLYALQSANFILPLVTIPYLARILRPSGLGLVVFVQAFSAWGSLVLEYGFNLSATREIARHRDEPNIIAKIVADVTGAKILLITAATLLSLVAGFFIPVLRHNPACVIFALIFIIGSGFSPLWFFQGNERMFTSASVDVFIRLVSTVVVFLFVHLPSDGWKVLALQAAGALLSSLILQTLMYRNVRWVWPRVDGSLSALKLGWPMFLFRSSVSLYTTANAFILGLFVSPAIVAYYGGAEKISKAFYMLLNPISQALYPRMSNLIARDNDQATKLARASMLFIGGLGIVVGIVILLGAPMMVRLLLGPGYEASVPVLRAMSLLVPMIALSNVLGIQWMLPMGLDKLFNTIIITAGALNLVLALFMAPTFGIMGMAWSVNIAETYVTVSMFVTLWWRGSTLLTSGAKNEG